MHCNAGGHGEDLWLSFSKLSTRFLVHMLLELSLQIVMLRLIFRHPLHDVMLSQKALFEARTMESMKPPEQIGSNS